MREVAAADAAVAMATTDETEGNGLSMCKLLIRFDKGMASFPPSSSRDRFL